MPFLKPPDIETKSPNQVMLQLLEFYKQIPFEENNEIKGHWGELFQNQLLFCYIEIIEKQLVVFQRKREFLVNNAASTPIEEQLHYLSALIELLERWLSLSLTHGIEWIWKEIKNSVQDINLGWLYHFYTINNIQHTIPGHFLWEGRELEHFNHPIDQLPSKSQLFEDCSYRILNCLLHIQNNIKEKDWEQLVATQQHPAHIGLMYGFCKAFDLVKAKLNELPKRHLDFYYQTVLQQKKKNATADFTYLFIKLKENIPQYELEKNTLFKAGTNADGTAIEFINKQSVTLSGAKLVHLSTLLAHASTEEHPLHTVQGITGIYYENIPLPNRNLFGNPNPWRIFGEPVTKNLITIGWAMASPLFYSMGGFRQFKIGFRFTEQSSKKARSLIKKMAKNSSYSLGQLYYYLFHKNFDVRITALSGWKSIPHEFLLDDFLNEISNSIYLQFDLTEKEEAWIPYHKDIHPGQYKEIHPVIEIVPQNTNCYYPYSFLKELEWDKCNVALNVTNSSATQLYNKHGLIDQTAPFPLLGVNPSLNDEFYIGNIEWAYKNLQSLDIHIQWDQLPEPNFETYYQEYETGNFKDADFIIEIPEINTTLQYPLFTLTNEGKLNTHTTWEKIPIQEKLIFTTSSKTLNFIENPDAFIKFNLSAPTYGFGHTIYRNEMIDFSKKQIQFSKKKIVLTPPNPPFIPYAKKITVSYSSSNSIDFSTTSKKEVDVPFSVYHIHPMGTISSIKNDHIHTKKLVPSISNRGYLYMGVQQLNPGQVLSLYFKMKKSFTNTSSVKKTLRIEYLDGNKWDRLDEGKILKSTINEGTSSGVVSFKTPDSLSSNHPFFASENYWFRLSVNQKYIDYIGTCECIITNPVIVERYQPENYIEFNHVPADTIQSLLKTIQEIDKIVQPMPTIGGKNKETEDEFYERVAKRLQHKNRIVRIEDYKNLILERFEHIKWVKIITPTISKKLKAGEVHIIIMPKYYNLHELSESASIGIRLDHVKNFIKSKAFPVLNIKVYSPQPEIVKVYTTLVINDTQTISLEEIHAIINEEIAPWTTDINNNNFAPDSSFNILKLTSKLKRLAFIKEVKNCGAVKISHNKGKYHYTDTADGQEILKPTTYKNILIPAEDHKISIYQANTARDEVVGNVIGGMMIGSDLIIEKEHPENKPLTPNEKEKDNYYLVKINQKKNNYGST